MWQVKNWISGFRAFRDDGEMVFIYKRPPWGSGLCGCQSFLELRSRGELVGRITSESGWRPRVVAEWLASPERPLNETDLLEITAAIKF
jgi:hypothetical protein